MGNNLYDNLLKATNNIDDITNERYATVTKLNGNYCDVKEEDTGLVHTNVPIVNGPNLSVGDKAIIGFINNSIYDAVCYGALDKTVHDDSKQDLLISGQNIKTINHTSLLGSGNIDIQRGGSDVDIVTSWEPTPSDTKVPSEKLTKNTLDTKVDKVTGKGLSTNDFTNSYKNTIDGLSTVATTGDYDDLTDKPTIPSKISDLTNDSDFIEKSSTTGLVKNDGTIDTTSYSTFSGSYNDLSGKPTIPSASTTTPSADTSSGSYGSGTTYARSNHTHPKSSLYAEATHSHTKSQITDFPTIPTNTSDLTNDGADGTNVFVANNDSRLSDARTPTSHTHGQITNAGAITSTAVTVASGDNIVITDASDSSKIKRVTNLLAGHIKDSTAHTNIGSSANDTQATINSDIDTALSNKVSKSSTSGLLKNDGTIDTTSYSTFSGSYNDLSGKPTIPSKTSQLTNDSGFLTTHQSLSNYYNKSEANNYDVDFILGTQTTSTSAWTGTTDVISNLREGTTIFYKLPYASTSTSVTLNLTLKGGGTTGAKNVFYKNTTRVTTHFGVGQVVGLTYDGTAWYVISPSDNNSNNDNNYGGIQFKAGEALTTQTICCAKNNGQYYKVANGVVLDIRYPLIMTSSAVASGTTTNTMYRTWYGVNIANTKSMTLTNGSQLFLEGTAYSNGKFTISSNVVTHTLTNGRYYIKVGTALSTTQIRFISDMTVYYYNGTTLKPAIKKEQIVDFPTLHTVATSGSYNDLLDKPNIPSGVVVDLNLDGTSNNAVANSAVVGGLNDKIEASDISFGFDADTKEIYIEVK